MTASQALGVLLGVAILSSLFGLIYLLQEKLNVEHRQRLAFLRVNLAMTWLAAVASIFILLLNVGKAIGRLLPAGETLNRAISNSRMQVLVFESDNSWLSKVVLGVYLIGLLVMLIRLLRSYLQMRRLLLNSSGVQLAGRDIRVADLITSPFSFGFFNPQIFVPSKFVTERSAEETEVMLTHEETHLKNRDPQWVLISLLTRAALFFSPVAFYLHKKLELEMEIECDRLTMQKTNLTEQTYGNLLIDTVANLQSSRPNPMFTYMSNTNLKRRIQAMTAQTSHRPVLGTFFGALILVASLTAIAATSDISKFKGQFKVTAEIVLDGKVVSSPQFIVLPNEPASLEVKAERPESALRMMLTAADFSSADIAADTANGIALKMALDYKTQTRSFRANPRVVVAPGEVATVMLGSNAHDTLEMRIKAERQ